MRVRATDPRPCPKCGKIYRSAHTLRTHLEDKHTVCPGYRCVLCGTVAKSRNSLHSHMSRQHRGISTKDLPVLPMPSAFDPELASRLLAKAGVKISPAELRARASPTSSATGGGNNNSNGNNGNTGGGAGILGSNSGGSQTKLNITGGSGAGSDMNEEGDDSDDDPEDLTTGSALYGSSALVGGNDLSRYHESLLSTFGQHANTTISRIRNEAAAAAVAAAALGQQHQKELSAGTQIPTSTAATGQSLLDTYLQFITENTFGMGMSQEHAAAAAALHAAKMAQLNAMGHGLEKIPAGLLQPQFDLSKLGASAYMAGDGRMAADTVSVSSAGGGGGVGGGGISIEPVLRRAAADPSCPTTHHSLNSNGPSATMASTLAAGLTPAVIVTANNAMDIRRSDFLSSAEPMDLGLDSGHPAQKEVSNEAATAGIGRGGSTNAAEHDEENYSVDESGHQA